MGRMNCDWDLEEDFPEAPEVIEALVAEAESDHHKREFTHQFVGRPKDPEVEALRRIVCRVPARVRNAAQKRADEQGVSLSEFAAEALREHLKRTRRKDS